MKNSSKREIMFTKMTTTMAELKRTGEVAKRNLEASRRKDRELLETERSTLGVHDDWHHDPVNAQNHPEHGAAIPGCLVEIHGGDQVAHDGEEMEIHDVAGHASEEAIDIEDLSHSTGDESSIKEDA